MFFPGWIQQPLWNSGPVRGSFWHGHVHYPREICPGKTAERDCLVRLEQTDCTDPGKYICCLCCGSWMFIPDLDFSIPDDKEFKFF
jgi:hypothetical protein